MKIFTRILLSFLAVSLVFGSQAASFGVVPGVLPTGTRGQEITKSDTVLLNWRTGASLTVTDFGISNSFPLTSYNPNAQKYSPLLSLSQDGNAFSAKPGVKSIKAKFKFEPKVVVASNAVQEQKITPSLNAYPNPSKGLTKISLSPLGDDSYKIRISNAIGKVYKIIPITKETVTETVTVDLSPLPAGIYFYSLLVNEKMVETKRLILQAQ